MHYYIDGYNMMFRLVHAGGELELQRREIIEELNDKAKQFGLTITIVFDAHQQEGEASRTHYHHLEILYSAQNQTADDLILHMLKGEKHPQECTVVTSDKKLAWHARHLSVRTESVETYMNRLSKRHETKQNKEKTSLKDTVKTPDFYRWLQIFEERLEKGDDGA